MQENRIMSLNDAIELSENLTKDISVEITVNLLNYINTFDRDETK